MSKFSVSSITKHKPSKRTIYITLAVAVLAALFIVGMISQVRQSRHDKAVQIAQAAEYNDMKAENEALKKQVSQLQTANSFNEAKAASTCDYIRATNAARRVAIPPLCQVKQ